MLLSVGPTYAGSFVTIQHNFHDMSKSQLKFNPSYTVGTIAPDTTYTCGGAAKFYFDKTKTKEKICIFMENEGDNVIVSPAIEYMNRVQFRYFPSANLRESISVYIKEEGDADWTEVTDYGSYLKGSVDIPMPAKGNYQVKIQNSGGSKFYINQIDYTTDPETCSNCFRYVPE